MEGTKADRGPAELQFPALLRCLATHIDRIADTRQQAKVNYALRDCYLGAFAMFYLQDPSLLEFQRRFHQTVQRSNLETVFGLTQIPGDSQLRDVIDRHPHGPLSDVYSDVLGRLSESGVLKGFEFLPEKYLLTIDGTQYFGSDRLQCPHCLVKQHKDGRKQYSHQILQATIVRPDVRQVIPFAPEFIANEDGRDKQDCELTAAKRLIARLRASGKALPYIIVGDSLYSKQPFILSLLQKPQPLHFILVAKPTDHKDLFANIDGLRRGKLLERKEFRDKQDRLHRSEWVNDVPVNADPKSPSVNFLEYTILAKDGSLNFHNSWVTDLTLDEKNVEWITRGGRARWKIENESFNTLKNQGYHIEHNFGHGSQYLSEALFLLNLLAFFFHQIFELLDGLYQQARAGFSARREYWNAIRNAFRMFLFNNWEQVLQRITSPPLPAFP